MINETIQLPSLVKSEKLTLQNLIVFTCVCKKITTKNCCRNITRVKTAEVLLFGVITEGQIDLQQSSSLKFENNFSKICVFNKVDSFSFRLANLLAGLNIPRLYNNCVFKEFVTYIKSFHPQNDRQNRGSLAIPMWKSK